MLLFWTLLTIPAVLAGNITRRANGKVKCGVPGNNRYIAVFRDDVSIKRQQKIIDTLPHGAKYVYDQVLEGFSAKLEKADLEKLKSLPEINYVEKDTKSRIHVTEEFDTDVSPKYDELLHLSDWADHEDYGLYKRDGEEDETDTDADDELVKRDVATRVELKAPWGLARISVRGRPFVNYRYHPSAGAGTCSYVVDSGIDTTHRDFQGRAKQIKSFVPGQTTDTKGHGTHLAGIIGGRVYGVAKRTKLYGVKVTDEQGCYETSSLIAGLEFVARDRHKRQCPRGVIVNLSLGGPFSRSVNRAVRTLARKRVFIAASAGNDDVPASRASPGSESWVCTVASSDYFDMRSETSNYGRSVDVFAPGVRIKSTLPNGRLGVKSGTSMAAAHVSGLAAYLGGLEGYRGYQLCNRIKNLATRNALVGVPDRTPNRLAFTGIQPRRVGRRKRGRSHWVWM